MDNLKLRFRTCRWPTPSRRPCANIRHPRAHCPFQDRQSGHPLLAAKRKCHHRQSPRILLQLFGIHQRFHCYVPHHDYLSGLSNPIADALSRDFHLTDSNSLISIKKLLPQPNGYQVWTPSQKVISSVITALLRQRSDPESLLVVPKALKPHGNNGKNSSLSWPSTPFSKPSKTKYLSYKSSLTEFVPANLQPTAIPSGLDRLKITYGSLARRSSVWGPRTPA